MKRRLADPFVRVAVVLTALAAVGVVALALAWRGAAATLAVWDQVPFFVSGGIGGAALIGTGLGLLLIHIERQAAADERELLDDVIHDAADIAEALRS